MGKIIFHVPYEKMITLNYLFKKDEKRKCVDDFIYKVTTGTYFNRRRRI